MTTTFNFRRLTITICLAVFAFAALTLTSCEKRVTPKKVERIVKKDSWRISIFVFEGQNIESDYTGQTFDFTDEGKLVVVPVNGVQGNYNVGLNKKPTLMYISGFFEPEYFFFNDDWEVTRISNSQMQFESQNGSFLNRITWVKVEN